MFAIENKTIEIEKKKKLCENAINTLQDLFLNENNKPTGIDKFIEIVNKEEYKPLLPCIDYCYDEDFYMQPSTMLNNSLENKEKNIKLFKESYQNKLNNNEYGQSCLRAKYLIEGLGNKNYIDCCKFIKKMLNVSLSDIFKRELFANFDKTLLSFLL